MKIFITGGTGVLGKRLVPKLVELGHSVGVVVRSEKKAEVVKSHGAIPIKANLFDQNQVETALEGYDAVIHLATAIPTKVKTKPNDWDLNNRLRTEATKILLDASLKHNVQLYIQESFMGIYGHHDDTIVNETQKITTPVETAVNIGNDYQQIFSSLVKMEALVQEANSNGLPTIILRFGMFYAHDASMIPDMAEGKFPIVGDGMNYMSVLNIEDAVESILAAVKNFKSNTGKVFNIADNNVPTMKELLSYSSQVIGKKKASKAPRFLVRLLFGKFALNFMTNSTRMDNTRAKTELSWEPIYSSYQEGIKHEIDLYRKFNN